MSTNKSFGIVFFIVFIIIALYPLLNQENLRIWSLIIFFFVITPIALLMKVMKKDLLNLKFNSKKTYWIERTDSESSMKNQF